MQISDFQSAGQSLRCCAQLMTWDCNNIFKAILDSWIWPIIGKAIEVSSEAITLILGLIALFALIFHGKRVTLLLKALSYQYVSTRAQKVRDTVSKLNARSYDDKEHRREIIALLGELSGRLKPFVDMAPPLGKAYQDLETLLTTKSKITESSKRRLLTEIEVALDSIGFETVKEFLSLKE
jgi:hypothetical protein